MADLPVGVDPLRDYYLDWSNFNASDDEIAELLTRFWSDCRKRYGALSDVSHAEALQVFEPGAGATQAEMRRRWRQLAFRWHPDRDCGDTERFKQVCPAWQVLNL